MTYKIGSRERVGSFIDKWPYNAVPVPAVTEGGC
jgi:hypothetical protein